MTTKREKKSWSAFWRELRMVGVGYVVVSILGAMLISPIGPGSDRIAYVCLLVYSLLVALACSGFPRVLSLVLSIAFLVGVITETKAREDFERHIREKYQQKLLENVERGKSADAPRN